VKRILIALIAVAPLAAHANLIKNGNFESSAVGSYAVGSSLLSGWKVIGKARQNVYVTGDWYLGQRTKMLDLSGTSDSAGSGVEQTISTVAGRKYDVSFNVYTGGLRYNGGVDFKINGLLIGAKLQGEEVGNTIKTYKYSFLATSTTTVSFQDVTGGYVSHIDNVSVSAAPVPEPATMAILGMGAFALIRRRKNA
jgi:hypothetical protein